MASPMVEGRLDPHKKAHFTLHVSDRIADGEVGEYTSVKYNHKPAQPTSSRTTTLTPTSPRSCALTVQDDKPAGQKDVYVFTGQKTAPKKSYILLFDSAAQKATLEPLASTYTFNIAKKNGVDISESYSKIYPRKQKDEALEAAAGDDDLFDDGARDDIDADPDADNPFDFRHFLSKEQAKRGDESEYNIASSPDYRPGTGSALNTPQFPPRKAAPVATKPKAPAQSAPKPKKRKSPEPEPRKAAPKKQAPPTVRVERRATQQTAATAPAKPVRKAPAAPPSSKIKSAEIVHSSDESDVDADGEAEDYTFPTQTQETVNTVEPYQRSPSPVSDASSPPAYGDGLEIEIEVPDERPNNHSRPNALSSLGLGQSIGLGYGKSPSAGPISLASAANSVEGSPNPLRNRDDGDDDDVIDFGDLGGGAGSDDEDVDMDADADADGDDVDVEPMDIGPPAVEQTDADAEEEDPLVKAMMMGLAGGDSSEESEEE